MRLVRSACILQTLIFVQKTEGDTDRELSLKANREEFERYKQKLDEAKIRYQIVGCAERKDGALVVHVRKQYNETVDVTEYFSKN